MADIFDIPTSLGEEILKKLTEANPTLEEKIGFLLVAVTHGQPVQTVSNVDEANLLYLAEITHHAIHNHISEKAAAIGVPRGQA